MISVDHIEHDCGTTRSFLDLEGKESIWRIIQSVFNGSDTLRMIAKTVRMQFCTGFQVELNDDTIRTRKKFMYEE